jgi:hypothetical protein
MDLYSVLLFVHMLSAMGLFGVFAVEAVAFVSLRRAGTLDEGRMWMGLLRRTGRLGPIAMVPLLVAGIWMMALRWDAEPWIVAALVGVAAMAVLAGATTRRAMRRFAQELPARAELGPEAIAALVAAGPLALSLRLRVALAIGILALMTMKPGALGSFATMALASALGAAVGLRPRRSKREPARTKRAISGFSAHS